MQNRITLIASLVLAVFATENLTAQTVQRKTFTWETKKINIGPVLDEKGPVEVEFFAKNENQVPLLITDVVPDCGCTTVGYSKDSIPAGQIGSIKVQFNPEQRGGEFSKGIIVRTNEDIYGDTLFLEGINMPLSENPEMDFPHRMGSIGMRLSAVNFGYVFTNEPKIKYVEVHNFGTDEIRLADESARISDYLSLSFAPEAIQPGQRGLLVMEYNGEAKKDLGFFEEKISLKLKSGEDLGLRVLAVVYEYFPPVPKSMENMVPRLGITETEFDLREISANQKVSRTISMSNTGQEPLHIRKVSTNCNCVVTTLGKDTLQPGERTELAFTFDPKGRRGNDHKHITIFSNDPINPVRTIVVRSSVR
jgi:hypothetical protein